MSFLDSIEHNFPTYDDKIDHAKQLIRMAKLRQTLQKNLSEKYLYEVYRASKVVWEHIAIMIVLVNIVAKCNIVALVYLLGVVLVQRNRSLKLLTYTTALLLLAQYWVYLFDLTPETSPSGM